MRFLPGGFIPPSGEEFSAPRFAHLARKRRETRLDRVYDYEPISPPVPPRSMGRAEPPAGAGIVGTPFGFIVIPFFPSANKRFGGRTSIALAASGGKFRFDGD